MVDIPRDAIELKEQLLQVLKALPINNKTILKDSKILNVVEKWSAVNLDVKKQESFRDDDGSNTPKSVCTGEKGKLLTCLVTSALLYSYNMD